MSEDACSTLVILLTFTSHRLSTITSADQILVLDKGRVAEAGTHHELIDRKGRYYEMWRKQIKAERAMEKASEMYAKAKALTEASTARPSSSGNEAEGDESSPSGDVSENEADSRTTSVTPSLASKALLRAAAEGAKDGSSSNDGSAFGDDTMSTHNKHDENPEPETDKGKGVASLENRPTDHS